MTSDPVAVDQGLSALLSEAFGPDCPLTPTAMLPIISHQDIRDLTIGLSRGGFRNDWPDTVGIPMVQRMVVYRVEELPRVVVSHVDEPDVREQLLAVRFSTWTREPERRVVVWKMWVIDPKRFGETSTRGLDPTAQAIPDGPVATARSSGRHHPEAIDVRAPAEPAGAMRFTRSLVHSFCEAIDDSNPFHTLSELAQQFGLSDSNVPGSLLACWMIATAEGEHVPFESVQFRFKNWVYASEPLELRREGHRWWLDSPMRGPLVEARFSTASPAS